MHQKIHVIPAYYFKAKSLGDGDIQAHVNANLKIIEDDMQTAIENEQTFSRTELSSCYDVSGMNRARACKHIYYHVIQALEQAGYTPRINVKKRLHGRQEVWLYVTWLSKKETIDEQYMTDFIESHRIITKTRKRQIR